MFSLAAQQHLVNEKGEAPSELLSNASGDLGDRSHDTAVDAQGYALSSARSALPPAKIAVICALKPLTKPCSFGPALARSGLAASTRISSASVRSTAMVSSMNW